MATQDVQEFEYPKAELMQKAPMKMEIVRPEASTPNDLLRIAVEKGADIAQLRELMALKREWEADEARKAFAAAMVRFKGDLPQILKNKHVKFGQTEYDHATLDHICDAVIPKLSEYGFSHNWESPSQEAHLIRVTCVLTHEQGHSKTVTLSAGPDKSGSKNDIQALGSAASYLQRYTLLMTLGIATKGADDDGKATGGTQMDSRKIDDYVNAIAGAPSPEILQRDFTTFWREVSKSGDVKAKKRLLDAKDARKAELAKEIPA